MGEVGGLTAGLVVVHVDALQLQAAVPVVGARGVDGVFIRDHLPELRDGRGRTDQGQSRGRRSPSPTPTPIPRPRVSGVQPSHLASRPVPPRPRQGAQGPQCRGPTPHHCQHLSWPPAGPSWALRGPAANLGADLVPALPGLREHDLPHG